MKHIFLLLSLLALITINIASPLKAEAYEEICFLGFCYYPDAAEQNSDWSFDENYNSNNTTGYGNQNTKANLSTGQGILVALGDFFNRTVLPLLFAIALFFFIYNAARYFIIEHGNQESKDKAKRLALYGIAAFVLLVSLWGIVNMFVGSLGWNRTDAICPDYLGDWCNDDPASNGNERTLPPTWEI